MAEEASQQWLSFKERFPDTQKSWDFLSEYDHTILGTWNMEDQASKHIERVQTDLAELQAMHSATSDAETAEGIRDLAKSLGTSLQGYEFRKQKKLPGLSTQFHNIRKAMVKGEPYFSELELLSAQPDGEYYVDQLTKEQQVFEEVLDKGGTLDLDALEKEKYRLFQGIDLMTTEDLEAHLNTLHDLAARAQGSNVLAKIQGRPELVNNILATVDVVRTKVMFRYAESLERGIDRLSMTGRINIPEEARRKHREKIEENANSNDTLGRLEESFRFMCESVGLEPEIIIEKGLRKQQVVKDIFRLEGEIDEARIKAEEDSIFDDLPIINKRRAKNKDENRDKLFELFHKERELKNRLELLDTIELARKVIEKEKQSRPYARPSLASIF